MEATGYSRWFERLLAELGFEVWIGDPAEIKTKRVKKQKTDREDARLMRKLLLEIGFLESGCQIRKSGSATAVVAPASVGADAHANHESTAGAGHERRLSLEEEAVQRTRTSAVREALVGSLGQSAAARVVGVTGPYESTIEELTAAVDREAKKRADVLRLMTHPGVGPLTALAYVLIIGTWNVFHAASRSATTWG